LVFFLLRRGLAPRLSGYATSNGKSAFACPTKTEVADFVRLRVQSFKE
jgi:hypothetical protein